MNPSYNEKLNYNLNYYIRKNNNLNKIINDLEKELEEIYLIFSKDILDTSSLLNTYILSIKKLILKIKSFKNNEKKENIEENIIFNKGYCECDNCGFCNALNF